MDQMEGDNTLLSSPVIHKVGDAPSSFKKIAAKSIHLKSQPRPHILSVPVTLPSESETQTSLNSSESFKTAASTEIVDENNHDPQTKNDDDDDSVPPARPVTALGTPQPPMEIVKSSGKKRKRVTKKKSTSRKEPKNGFWEIDHIVAVRKRGRTYEYLVKWKGDFENTWEPQKNLNKNALAEAKDLLRNMEQNEIAEPAETFEDANEEPL
jgi:hypothetical protein